ncbi:hypothetical protein FPZ43_16945 [Mucilaginibacter pallidiroseus]|uniref:Uncharacterized protein n=1 Tax=Mucilaginibacter pallidiroseus TaxID=2599295 RepID=A0A563U2E5_9SPHI|nr:hypothetical protein [Mucilaginibacter pallidiroseus]TWR25159.1 hypothetical protein FPZ43_16945 [Mucilaginibacter pallidiroseus]
MQNRDLPIYAIVELLLRIATERKDVGDYKNHHFDDNGVTVTTTFGRIIFSTELIARQFLVPEQVSYIEIKEAQATFEPML